LSWRHFVVGAAHLGRHRAREKLRHADAVAVSQAEEKERRRWIRTHEIIADL
jgi:tRNA A37 N6-isopentenylltransferase MiaA